MNKVKYSPLITGLLLLCLCSCSKDALVSIAPYTTLNTPTIIGKWYENKLVVQHKTNLGGMVADTAFSSAAFSTSDSFQFNSDSTAVYNQGATLNALSIGPSSNGMGVINLDPQNLKFAIKSLGLRVSLSRSVPLSGGVAPYTDFFIEQLTTTNLVLSSVDSTSTPGFTNTYYIYYAKK